jgi:hypothetical protein
MGKENSPFKVNLNKDCVMEIVVNRLGYEAICWALVFHIILLFYVGCTNNLVDLSVPPEEVMDMVEDVEAVIGLVQDAGRDIEMAAVQLGSTVREVGVAVSRLESAQKNIETVISQVKDTERNIEAVIIQLKDTGRDVGDRVTRLENTRDDVEMAIIRLENTRDNLEGTIPQLRDGKIYAGDAITGLESTRDDLGVTIAQLQKIEENLELKKIAPLKDPIFYTGIVLIIIIGCVWLRLSSVLPDALGDLEEIKGEERHGKNGEEMNEKKHIIFFKRILTSIDNFYGEKFLLPAVRKISKKRHGYEFFLARFEYMLNTRLSWSFGLAGILCYLLYQYKKAPIYESMVVVWVDWRVFPDYAIFYGAIWAICYFILGIMVWKLLLTAIFIKKFFDEYEVDIRPFHPDKVGGLKPVTNIVININMFVFAGGISLVIIYSSYLKGLIHHIWIIFVGYILVSVFLFFYPLLGARKSMKESKEKYMESFSKSLIKEYENASKQLATENKDDDTCLKEDHAKRVKTLKEFYDQAALMPVWPFDRDTVLTFASRILLPVVLVVINMVIAKYMP